MINTGIPHDFTEEQMKFLEAYLFTAYKREDDLFTKGVFPPHSYLGVFTKYFKEDLLIEVVKNLELRGYLKLFKTDDGHQDRVAVQLTHKCLAEMASVGRISPQLMALFGDAAPPMLCLPRSVEEYLSLKRAIKGQSQNFRSLAAGMLRELEELLTNEPAGCFPEPEPLA